MNRRPMPTDPAIVGLIILAIVGSLAGIALGWGLAALIQSGAGGF